ncbi:2-halobenzoate 1,2-dioxygenase large subunit (plasmid) [Sphingobium sp. AntQ-1]|uniref:aromatic ring-hydroxylating oxygenase subunit alpha n=1 Tax=Sphingobium sp. AntQ-1 TaxID=2930091 RepID=UPI00234F7534|nr:Rieske 2Fe-2S domain-containing protein [Sphingobium sp. AntQ-1]WCP15969.1 2-halobenzoate 1,2-dioxygenase large subunit [Sphingobium sp. AntQ-1]
MTIMSPADMVKNGMVHADVYTDPDIFELEMDRLFQKCWMFVGHESEIAEPGMFRLRQIGRQPVIFVRAKDGSVEVLVNRCRHRGAVVCEQEGKASRFHCPYHGWTYANDGKLIGVPDQDAYGADFRRQDYGLSKMPRVESYRGFVFASGSTHGPGLVEHLGRATDGIDLAIDFSPTGEIALDAGSYKTFYNGNWKHLGMDGYHPGFLHQSVLARYAAAGEGHFDNPWELDGPSVTRHYGRGHTMLDLSAHRLERVEERIESYRKLEGGEQYVADMHAAYGTERARLLIAMGGDPHMGLFPNLQLIGTHVRIINPIAVDKTEVIMLQIRLPGVPDAINEHRLRHHEMFYGPAGAGSPDDMEIFERVQRGLAGAFDPWLNMQRGMGRERVDSDGSIIAQIGDELPQRAQLETWLTYMQSGEGA